jgi:DNA-binding MarR family transcriptional regulator
LQKQCKEYIFATVVYATNLCYTMENLLIDIEMIFAILSGKVSSAINRKLYKAFRETNLSISPEQWSVLLYLWQGDGVTQQELCKATFKDKPSITRLITNLEKQNLVVRIPHKDDKRNNLIYLTKNGRDLYKVVKPITTKTMEQAVKGLNMDEIKIGEEIFKKVFNNLQ